MNKELRQRGFRRFLLVLAISVVLTVAGSEAAYLLQKEKTDRPPSQIELVIPAGAAEQIAAGVEIASIPEEMVFVAGDELVVLNQDSTSHQLGPLWIPANGRASLLLDSPSQYAYQCSFQASNYLGIDVRPPTTLFTRFQAVVLAAPATAIFLFIYSLLVFPLQNESRSNTSQLPYIRFSGTPSHQEEEGPGRVPGGEE